mmetsp:Transcript_52115/g.93409  ORF Transcript_52115/g.93409 Transcript_52115/m.93409 type:complete len:1160 (+) Transcript_52115:87-3566(+)
MWRWLLLSTLSSRALGQTDLYADTGLLGEFFAPLPEADSCDPVNGSTQILENLVPTIVRKVSTLNFIDRASFEMDRCAWEQDERGSYRYECRGQEELMKNFAARFTGRFYVYVPGYYTFELESDDGARMIVGHENCPGLSCAERYNVTNVKFQELRKNNVDDNSYGKQCEQCSLGVYIDCWVTNYGCEPFSLWQMEGDGGVSGKCHHGPSKLRSKRWFDNGLHAIRIEYFQRDGPGYLIWKYSGPDTGNNMVIVPSGKLQFPRYQGFVKDVFDITEEAGMKGPEALPPTNWNGKPYAKAKRIHRVDDQLQLTGPGEGTFSDEIEAYERPIYVRWTGNLQINLGGRYKFEITSDDGGRFTLGGRGFGGEMNVVDNDGIKAGAKTLQGELDNLLPGLHPVRVEYLYVPDPDAPYLAIPRKPGITVTYAGPDTADIFLSISRAGAAVITSLDYGCELRQFTWGNGMSVSRDCIGNCFIDQELMVGDRICDDGTGGTRYLKCPEYNMDNGDCDPNYAKEPITTPRPAIKCLESCPTGGFERKNCDLCPNPPLSAGSSSDGVYCDNGASRRCSNQDDCSFLGCCVAKIYGDDYWGQDCLAFGTPTNCTHELEVILDDFYQAQLPFDSLAVIAARDPPRPRQRPTGQLMVDCNEYGCNRITDEFEINPFTNLYTDDYVCPVQESKEKGLLCYQGPFEITGVTDVLTECQDENFEWNFCRDRKSVLGRPFVKCCNFLYINPIGAIECRFMGIPQGTCETVLEQLRLNLSMSAFTRISDTQVMYECDTDGCNNPKDEVNGCPDVVNEDTPITDGIRSTNKPTLEELLVGAEPRPPDPPPWGLIGGLSSIPFVLVCCAMLLNKLCEETPEPIFHSSKAEVIGNDTFVEPIKDSGGILQDLDMKYGRVEPRPIGLTALMNETKVVPEALRQNPALAVPEAAQQAWTAAVAEQEALEDMYSPNRRKSTPQDFAGGLPLDDRPGSPSKASQTSYESSEESGDEFWETHHEAMIKPDATPQRPSRLNSAKQSSGSIQSSRKSRGESAGTRGESASSRLPTITDRPSSPRSASAVSQAQSSSTRGGQIVPSSRSQTVSQPGQIVEYGSGYEESVVPQPEPPTPPPVPEIGHVEPSVSGLALNQVSVGNLHRPPAAARMLRQQQRNSGVPRVAT